MTLQSSLKRQVCGTGTGMRAESSGSELAAKVSKGQMAAKSGCAKTVADRGNTELFHNAVRVDRCQCS